MRILIACGDSSWLERKKTPPAPKKKGKSKGEGCCVLCRMVGWVLRAFVPGGTRTEPSWGVWKDIVSVMIKGMKLDRVIEIQREGEGAQAQIFYLA